MTDERETMIELATAALLVLIFLLFLVRTFPESVAMLFGGVVLLGSGVYQKSKGWRVSLVTWILGGVLILGGIGLRLYVVARVGINWVPIVLVFIAAYMAWSWWRRRA